MPHTSSRLVHAAAIALTLAGTGALLSAQQPTPTPLLDGRGQPLPFGVQPYYKPDVPLGSGPFKAVMSEERGLSAHVVYAPADLSKLNGRKLPVVLWANGSCLYAGNRYRQLLTEVASHGYLAIAGGPMGDVQLEVGPQSNPAVRQGGAGAAGGGARGGGRAETPAPAAAAAPAPGTPSGRVTVALMKEAVDWAVKQNGDQASRFHDLLDLTHIVSMGHSCGGGVAAQLATEDSRINGMAIWFSGFGLVGARGGDPASVQKVKGPVLLITGEEALDIGFPAGKATFEVINHLPVFYGWQDKLQHIGTFGAKNGGELGVITVNWLDWTTRNDAKAAKMFKGASCTLCKDPAWHVKKKKID